MSVELSVQRAHLSCGLTSPAGSPPRSGARGRCVDGGPGLRREREHGASSDCGTARRVPDELGRGEVAHARCRHARCVLGTLDERAREVYLAHGRPVTAAYGPDHDVWFRYRDERDLGAWFRLLPLLLPGVLGAARHRLG